MGRDDQGNVIAPGLEVVERYPIGSQVAVFHDPQNPVDAVLETLSDTCAAHQCSEGFYP